MNAKIENVVYKGIKEIKAGSFTGEDGVVHQYGDSYKLRYEDIYKGLPTIFEIKCSKEQALNIARMRKIGDKITINFNVDLFPNGNMRCTINNII